MTLLAFMFAAVTASAQSVKPIKLGHIETSKLLEIMPEYKKAEETMRLKTEEIRKDFAALEARWQSLVQEYQTNGKNYSEPKREDAEKELNDLRDRMMRFEENAGAQLQTTREDLMRPIFEKIQNAIKQVGDDHGFTYIFEMGSGALNYASPSSEDVLPLVKKKLGLL
jgi:outer membrane protein